MPLRDDLLNPIPGPNPSGENLRYAPVYDKIKEARREDDDAPQGEWQRDRKVANYGQVIKLASEALATKSKDIQLVAWITEALLKTEGFAGLRSGLELMRGLLENFWDTLYPEIEDGDVELRSLPIEWVGTRLAEGVRMVALNKAGHNWFKYKECRSVPTEEEANNESAKAESRAAKIADGKLTPEEFDRSFAATPKEFYEKAVGDLDGILEAIDGLSSFCEDRFGDFNPSLTKLREITEEVRHTVNGLYKLKGGPDPVEEAEAEEAPAEAPADYGSPATAAAAAPARKPARKVSGIEPADREEVGDRLAAIAGFIRREDGYSPAPYLMLRGYRWGELRAGGGFIDAALLEAPSSEVRTQVKKMAMDSQWQELLEVAETAMATTAGRGWLDLQRYVVRACTELGYEAVGKAICSELRNLVTDFPDLPRMTLMDDTPTANAETQAWLNESVAPPPPEPAVPVPAEPEPVYMPPPMEEQRQNGDAEAAPDTYQLALEQARSGRAQDAIELLLRELAVERSGRGRFQRRMQVAQICMATGHEQVAAPILEQLAEEIEQRRLEEWETAEAVAHPLTLLYRCLNKLDRNPGDKEKLYIRICRLDPIQALTCAR